MENDDRSVSILTAKSKFWHILLAVVTIFSLALVLRYIGLKFGFPLFTHPDEGYLMNAVREMSLSRTSDPGTYVYPAYPSFYSRFLLAQNLSLRKFGGDYGHFYWRDPYLFIFSSRLLTAIQGALLPVIAWFIGRKFKGFNFALPAAALFIFYPPFVLHSHYVTVDIPLTLYVMVVLLFCLNYLSSNKNMWLVLACVFVAVAALEKYPGILSFGIVLATIGIRAFNNDKQKKSPDWGFILKAAGLSLLIIAVTVLVVAPSLLLHFDTAWRQIIQEARPYHLGSDGLGWGGNLLFYLKDFYSNVGLLICVFAAVGLAAAILTKDPAMLLLFFGGGYWIALSVLPLHHSRWSLPMMSTPLFLAAVGVSFLWLKAKHHKGGKIAVAFLILAGFVPFMLKGTVTSLMLTWQDTRNEALRYMEENDIAKDQTVSDGYSPYNPSNKNDIYAFDIFRPGEKKYLVLSSFMGERFAAEPERYSAENAFYANARSHLTLVKAFQPDPEPKSVTDQVRVIIEYVKRQFSSSEAFFFTGPSLEIYRLPD